MEKKSYLSGQLPQLPTNNIVVNRNYLFCNDTERSRSEGVSLPLLPQTKCLRWAWGEHLSIAAVFGDFASVGANSTSEHSRGQQLEEILGQALLQEIKEHFDPFVESQTQPCELDLGIKMPNGKLFVRLESVLQFDDAGQPLLFSYWQDITELKRAEHQAELLTQVINSIPSWIFLKNTDHDYEMVNSSYAEFYGCLLYTSPSPRDQRGSRMPSSA